MFTTTSSITFLRPQVVREELDAEGGHWLLVAANAVADTSRLRVGERVVLGKDVAPDPEGCLRSPEDVGVVEADDRDEKPFRVVCGGARFYYKEHQLARAPHPVTQRS